MPTCQRVVNTSARYGWRGFETRRCGNECVEGSTYCARHIGATHEFAATRYSFRYTGKNPSNAVALFMSKLKGFRCKALQEIYEEYDKSPNKLDLTDELNTVRTCAKGMQKLAERNAEKKDGTLGAQDLALISQLNKEVVAVAKQVAEVNEKLGTSITMDDAHVFADQFSNILIRHLSDQPEKLEAVLAEILQVFAPESPLNKNELAPTGRVQVRNLGFQAVLNAWLEDHPDTDVVPRDVMLKLRRDYAVQQIEALNNEITQHDDPTAYEAAVEEMDGSATERSLLTPTSHVPGAGRPRLKVKLEESIA